MNRVFRGLFLVTALALSVGASAVFAGDPPKKPEKPSEKQDIDPKKLLEQGLNVGDKTAVLKALELLGTQGGPETAKFIIGVALQLEKLDQKFSTEASNDIFDAAEVALANVKDEKGEAYIFDQLKKHKDLRVRVFLCDVTGKKKNDAAEAALLEALKDKFPVVAKTAIQHLGLRKSKKAFDPVIELLAKTEKKREEPWLDCLRFLTTMSGKDLATADDWKSWWAGNKDTYDPAKIGSVKTTPGGVGETVSRDAPKFFGNEILSKKCVFILDTSGSMLIKDPAYDPKVGKRGSVGPKEPGYGDVPVERMRMFRLQEAMVKLLESLPEDVHFTIITFGSSAHYWNSDLVPANAKNKQDAIEFARGMNPEGYTVTDEAIRLAFNVPDANTFYLFTDGIPQRGKNPDGTPMYIDRKEIIEECEQSNRTRKVKIFTIGFGEADANFLRQLAVSNDGTFTAVQ
jgi:hypothetical protein